jgi:hypothetical protein
MACNDLVAAVKAAVSDGDNSVTGFSLYDAIQVARLFEHQKLLGQVAAESATYVSDSLGTKASFKGWAVDSEETRAIREKRSEDFKKANKEDTSKTESDTSKSNYKPKTRNGGLVSKLLAGLIKADSNFVFRRVKSAEDTPYKGYAYRRKSKVAGKPSPTKSVTIRRKPKPDTSKSSAFDTDGFGMPIETLRVTQDTLNETYAVVSTLDNLSISTEHAEHLNNINNSLITQGFGRLGEVIVEVMRSNGIMNGGEFNYATKVSKLYASTASKLLPGMSLREAHIHELLHGVLPPLLLEDSKLLTELSNFHALAAKTLNKNGKGYEIFLHKDASGNPVYLTDKAEEIKAARETWDYIFNSTDVKGSNKINSGLLEFLAYGLTNENMVNALKNMADTTTTTSAIAESLTPKGDSIFSRIVKAILTAVDRLVNVLSKNNSANGYEKLYGIATAMINQQNAVQENRIEAVLKNTGINILNEKMLEPLNNKVSKLVKDANVDRFLDFVSNTSASTPISSSSKDTLTATQKSMYRAAYIKTAMAMTNASYLQANTQASYINSWEDVARSNSFLMHEAVNGIGLIGHLSRALRNEHPLLEPIIKLHSMAKAKREVVRKHFGDTAMNEFDNAWLFPLTETDKEVVGRASFATDMQSLTKYYTHKEIREFIDSPQSLKTKIYSLQSTIEHLVPNTAHSTALINQAKSIGYLMVDNKTPLANSARNIDVAINTTIKTFGKNKSIAENRASIYKAMDSLATLVAYSRLDDSTQTSYKAIWDREFSKSNTHNGITNMHLMLNSYAEQSKKSLFKNSNALLTKGHYPQMYAKHIEYTVADVSKSLELRKQGWEPTGKRMQDPISGVDKEFYTKRINSNDALTSGVFGVDSFHSRGTKLSDLLIQNQGFDAAKIRAYIDELTYKQTQLAKNQNTLGLFAKDAKGASHRYVPIRDANSNIVDYAIVMNDVEQVKYLGKSYNASNLIQSMYMTNASKEATMELNPVVVKELQKIYRDNPTRKHEFTLVHGEEKNADGSPNETLEYYRMLPSATRQLIPNGIHVPKAAINILFGGRKISLADTWLVNYAQEKFPDFPIKKWVSTAQTVWQEIVASDKTFIVIKSPKVVVNNTISNTNILLVEGLAPVDIQKYYTDAFTHIRAYEKAMQELYAIKAKINSTTLQPHSIQVMQSRANVLEKQVKANPIYELVEAGMYQTVAEDASTLQYGYMDDLGNYIKKNAQEIVGKAATDFGEAVFNNVMLTGNSPVFKLLNKATQYSDLIARYALMQHLGKDKSMSKEARNKIVLDTFINYDLPDPKSLTFLNDMGFMMFTKFFVGIQKVIARQAKKRTASLALDLAVQTFPGLDLDDITESSIFFKNYAQMIHLNPLDHLEHFTTPGLYQTVKQTTDMLIP